MHDVMDITVTPLSSACGAEISGVDLTRPLSEATVRAIKEAWGNHLVLVFRGQKLSQDDQLRFASYFGDLGSRKKAPEALRARTEGIAPGPREGAAGQQHQGRRRADRRVRRRRVLVPHRFRLYAAALQVHVPLRARTAVDRRQYACSRTCTRPTTRCRRRSRQKLKGKKALHIHEYNRARQANSCGRHQRHSAPLPSGLHHASRHRAQDAVRRPADDDAASRASSEQESDAILEQLYDIGERREFIFEHVWQLGDFLMWDNRCTIHARTDFPKEERRLLRRCTVEGEPLHE